MSSVLLLLAALLLLWSSPVQCASIDAEQIHLSIGMNQNDFYVNFVTFDHPTVSYVQYGLSPSDLSFASNASTIVFVDSGRSKKQRYMHEATMLMLTPSTTYYYQVITSAAADAPVFNFSTIPREAGYTKPLRIAMYGDYGVVNDQSHDRLQAESLAGNLDLIIHAGDIAYNLDDEEGDRGDAFMNLQQAFLTHTPMQVCAGNHEEAYNFSHYRARFHMPGDESGSNTNLYSSFNVGPVHFVSIDTELYFYDNYYNNSHIMQQYKWLTNDLAMAQKQREIRPWLVVFGHRPMYCTNDVDDDPTICTQDTSALRDGVSFPHGGHRVGPLEELLWQYNVDFYFSGHMHSYERLYPTYKGQVLGHDYSPLVAPLHIIAGAAGCQEYLDEYDYARYPWSAVTSDSYGYGKFIVHNGTHAEWQQILDEDGSILDHIIITKTSSGYRVPTQVYPDQPEMVHVNRHNRK